MTPFARLLEALVLTPSRNAKLTMLTRYFRDAPDPDRGWALAALAGTLDLKSATASNLRAMVEERVDPVLFRMSYDYVGDLAETIALIWPGRGAAPIELPLSEVVDTLSGASREEASQHIAGWLDRLGTSERLALIKLATGGLRIGVSERLAKTALAGLRDDDEATLTQIEELWHGVEPPYTELFEWLDGKASAPQIDLTFAFRPMMLAHPIDNALYSAEERRAGLHEENSDWTLARLNDRLAPEDFIAEWKWDGIRVQAIRFGHEARLYTRAGEEISGSFPDVIDAMGFEGVADGELLVMREGEVAPFADLQKRLGRKKPGAKTLRDGPGHIRIYDLLHDGVEDLRMLPLETRRRRLDHWGAGFEAGFKTAQRVDLSPVITFKSWDELTAIRAAARENGQEGLMLKRRDSLYTGGRPTGPWWKWKRAPLSADCVLMYAQRGHGKRSSYYSDFTFGAWRDGAKGPELTPVGKAYSGFTDEELLRLDKWVRANTTDRYGPVRAVEIGLVFEVSFDAVQASARHKSGIAMRFPRVKRIRWDKPADEADTLATLSEMIG